jgi:hypothetical protein
VFIVLKFATALDSAKTLVTVVGVLPILLLSANDYKASAIPKPMPAGYEMFGYYTSADRVIRHLDDIPAKNVQAGAPVPEAGAPLQ